MKAIRYITQILSALIYTPIFTGIMYCIIVFPFMWIVSLPFWKMILAAIVLGGIIEGIVMFLQTIGILPFAWIVKSNKLSLYISVLLCILLPIYNIYALWKALWGHGTFAVICAVILSGMLLQFVFGTIGGILALENDC